jgi:hypothetical protein
MKGGSSLSLSRRQLSFTFFPSPLFSISSRTHKQRLHKGCPQTPTTNKPRIFHFHASADIQSALLFSQTKKKQFAFFRNVRIQKGAFSLEAATG